MGVYVKTESGLAPAVTVPAPATTNQDVADILAEDGPAKTGLSASIAVGVAAETTELVNVTRAARAAGKRLRARHAGFARQSVAGVTLGALGSSSVSGFEVSLGTVTITSADNTFTTSGAHGLAVGDRIRLTGKTGGSFLNGFAYYVRTVPSTTTFTVYASNASSGGVAAVGSDGSATLYKNVPIDEPGFSRGWATATITAATDLWTTPSAHGLAVGDAISVTSSTATGVANSTRYYVKTVPSTTTFTVSATLGGTTLDVTGDGTAALGLVNPKFMVTDGRPVQSTTVFPQYDYIKFDPATVSVGAGTPAGGEITVHTVFDGDQIELLLFNDGTSQTRVYVDGILIDTILPAQLTAAGVGTSSTGQRLYTLPGARTRRISVRTPGTFAGWRSPASRPLARPTFNRGARWQFVGDSFTEGTGATYASNDGFVAWVRNLLELPDVRRTGAGSTGYVADGTRLALIDRYQNDIIAQVPDVCVICMGLNDSGAVLADVVTAATTIWDAVLSSLPGTELVIVGPFPNAGGAGTISASIAALDAALNAEATERGLRFISPVQDGLTYTLSDATHPDPAGHETIGTYLAGHLSVPYLPPAV